VPFITIPDKGAAAAEIRPPLDSPTLGHNLIGDGTVHQQVQFPTCSYGCNRLYLMIFLSMMHY